MLKMSNVFFHRQGGNCLLLKRTDMGGYYVLSAKKKCNNQLLVFKVLILKDDMRACHVEGFTGGML